MEFEWDENKREANKNKHGYDFDLAKILLAETHVTIHMRPELHGEQRYLSLAEFSGEVLAVVYTRRLHKYRIISLRKASRDERIYFRRTQKN